MNEDAELTDLELAAMISSKICHDVIGPISAICNGLEILDMDQDQDAKASAMDMIRNVSEQASARLQFARYAFGASGSLGSLIDLETAERISRGLIGQGKHKIAWRGPSGYMVKDKVKLLLNLVASAVAALPKGGEIMVLITGTAERPSFLIRCRGMGARPPQYLTDFIVARKSPPLDPINIQAYYTTRLAGSARMRLEILKEGADILLSAAT